MRGWATAAAITGVVTLTAVARADLPQRDPTRAEALFREARRHEAEDQTRDACSMYEESQRLDPTVGTLLNLALCDEKLGKTATAWTLFSQAASEAAKSGQEERANFARGRAAALEPRLARLRVEVPADAGVTTIQINGTRLHAPAWGVALPYDPGPVRIDASGEGRLSRSITVKLEESRVRSVVVEPLERATMARSTAPTTPPLAGGARAERRPDAPASGGRSRTRPLAYATLGAGAIGVGVGAVLGVMAIGKKGDVDGLCDDHGACQPGGAAAAGEARSLALGSTLGFAVGLGALAGGAALLVIGGRSDPSKVSGSVTVGPRGVAIGGRF